MQTLLFILQKAPYADSTAREALDVILAAASFEGNKISLLFLNDGLFLLCDDQNTNVFKNGVNNGFNVKPMSAMLKAIPLYGIKAIYAAAEDLRARGLNEFELVLPVELLSKQQIADLLTSADVIFNF